MKYNKSICEKNTEITSFNINEYKTLEKAISGKYESWILNIALAVNSAKQTAKSVEEFINILLQKDIKAGAMSIHWTQKVELFYRIINMV